MKIGKVKDANMGEFMEAAEIHRFLLWATTQRVELRRMGFPVAHARLALRELMELYGSYILFQREQTRNFLASRGQRPAKRKKS